MGDIQTARVDVDALLVVANGYEDVGDVIDGAVGAHLGRLTFGGALAGRDHGADGDRVRRAVDEVVDQMHVWARAMREIAVATRTSAVRYADVDQRGAARLG